MRILSLEGYSFATKYSILIIGFMNYFTKLIFNNNANNMGRNT